MKLLTFSGGSLTVTVKNLNIHKNTPENDMECDMELAEAVMTFAGVSISSYEPDRTWKTDAEGKAYSDDPVIIHTGEEAQQLFLRDLERGLCVFSLEADSPQQIVMEGCGDCPYFTVRIGFDSVRLEWDEYRKKAWYELHRYYTRRIDLETPAGCREVMLNIACHDENVYSAREQRMLEAPFVIVQLEYAGRDYLGFGTDDYWIDAFADLQKQLPDGVKLRCCLTCRHGNLCPTGMLMDELYCTKDVTITRKQDLYFYTEDPSQRSLRLRGYTDLCEDHQPQSADFYTYNDYLNFLNR